MCTIVHVKVRDYRTRNKLVTLNKIMPDQQPSEKVVSQLLTARTHLKLRVSMLLKCKLIFMSHAIFISIIARVK